MNPELDPAPRAPGRIARVAIVGGGFSGTIQAINLLRHDGPAAILIERRPRAGRGIAYSALSDEHVLNVRASNMSAFPDQPGHFVEWLTQKGLGVATDFVSRSTYGDYLAELLHSWSSRSPGRLTLIPDEAIDAECSGGSIHLQLAERGTLEADALVLAVGNLPPHEIPAVAAAKLDADLYSANPWSHAVADQLSDEDDVLVIGTGLTMVDTALYLAASGFGGRILAMSRRGLLPQPHSDPHPPSKISERPGTLSSALVRSVRERGRVVGWRNAVDELRPYTQSIWRASDPLERSRFLRHLRPWWDIHRHRIAPRVAARLDELKADGKLLPMAGKIIEIRQEAGHASVLWQPRGEENRRKLRVRRIVNCTGPQGDLLRTGEPLLRNMISRGMIRPDPNRLGIDVNQQGELIAADGSAQPQLFAVGPMTRGAFWEIVAVPDIRMQTWALARRLSDAHWVGGEGL